MPDNTENKSLKQKRAEEDKEARVQLKADKKQLKADLKAQKKEQKQRQKDIEERTAELNGDDTGGAATLIITLLIVLIWLVIMAILIKLDIGGFGSNVLAPIIRDVPYLNLILPDSVMNTSIETDVSSDSALEESSGMDSLEQANAYIRRLENELKEEMEENSTYAATIERLEAEVERLEPFEEEQAELQEQKASFYASIVYGDSSPDASVFASYYEMIEPEIAASIYAAIVQEDVDDEELEDYIKTYSSMKAKKAAAIFDVLVESDIDLVARILEGMSAETRGDILAAMDETNASEVTKYMDPGTVINVFDSTSGTSDSSTTAAGE
jgi:flagellar motility protein MotE (MotC chaperone)